MASTEADIEFMRQALDAARCAGENGDVPVGAVIVVDGTVVATAFNEKELRRDPTAHAEILAIRAVAEHLGEWRLSNATLYVTLEPCVMCAGAIVAARLARVVFGATDPKAGATGSLYNVCVDPRLNHEVRDLVAGVEAEACGDLLREFFQARRKPPSEL